MNRRWICFAIVLTGCWLVGNSAVLGQYGGQGSGMGARTNGTTGNQTAGAASSVSAAQGYGLDSRFTGSGFSRFTTGSAGMGQTTAGAGAATSGAFGQSAQGGMSGNAGNYGRAGGIGGMGGLGGMGGMGGMGMYGFGRNMFGTNTQQNNQGNKVLRTHQTLGFTQPLASASAIKAVMRRSSSGYSLGVTTVRVKSR